ncbi:MAG: IreB family regulatory phosphoprotein, partial [Zhenhengia sp.]
MKNINETVQFHFEMPEKASTRDILMDVYEALNEKGYNPINQIVGYIMSGDPTYITSYNG